MRYHLFEENGTAYYVMEYLPGGSLSDKLKSCGRLSEQDALRYVRQVASALGYVHGKNQMHLDVKPGNVMLDEEDNAVLIDFGLVKVYDEGSNQVTTTTSTMGGFTPGYAPLEQIQGGVLDFSPAIDIYALGATLYALVEGTAPPKANDVL